MKEVNNMAKGKQFVFSARTTEEGLKALNEVKARLNIGWDELVIEAISAHYGMDRTMMSLPREEKPTEQPPTSEPTAEQPAATKQEQPTEAKRPAKKQKKSRKKASGESK
jgi:hypothetical protein